MAWLCVTKLGEEYIFSQKPYKVEHYFYWFGNSSRGINIPVGTIEKIINKKLTWDDEPVELKGVQ